MTNKEAIDELEVIHERLSHPEDCEQGVYSFRDGDYLEALDMAIKALEQQLCEDCISREAAIDAIYGCYIGGKEKVENAPINDLYAEGLAEAVDAVWELPSVQPTRPTSRWSRQTDTYHDYYECENCGIGVGLDDVRNFCPNCGAEMIESEEEE